MTVKPPRLTWEDLCVCLIVTAIGIYLGIVVITGFTS